ncbi:MAG TPA: hypothetical protein HA349_09960 [Methanotrichaceae archaeon]|nr:hypothetical protein [Methanotrichaceae archaeon]
MQLIPVKRSAKEVEVWNLDENLKLVTSRIKITNSETTGFVNFAYCIFKNEVYIQSTALKRNFYLKGSQFRESFDFDNCEFSGDVDFQFVNFNNRISFDHARFNKDVEFNFVKFNSGVTFGKTLFGGDVGFLDAQFLNQANFNYTEFVKGASFGGAQFKDDAIFFSSQFGGPVGFSGTKFQREANFDDAQFKEDVSFVSARFLQSSGFIRAHFLSSNSFSSVQFQGYANFDHVKFDENADFTGAKFSKDATFRGSLFIKSFIHLGTEFHGSIDITDADFGNIDDRLYLSALIRKGKSDKDSSEDVDGENVVKSESANDDGGTQKKTMQDKTHVKPPEIAARPLGDRWSKIDLLGYSDYAEALADFIKNKKSNESLTIGIDAEWGVGKTTLMHMIKNHMDAQETSGQHNFGDKLKTTYQKIKGFLETKVLTIKTPQEAEDKSNLTIWFNAWKYDQEESLWSALALEILTQIRSRFGVWQQIQFWFKLNYKRFDWLSLLQNMLRSLFYLLGVIWIGVFVLILALLIQGITFQDSIQVLWQNIKITGLLVGFPALFAAGKKTLDQIVKPFDLNITQYIHDPEYEQNIGFLAQFEEDFKRVIDLVTVHGEKQLVVFIDDLDRCAPSHVADIIEAINVLLDADHCVFVIGMDSLTVANSIRAKYKDLEDYDDDAHDSSGLTLGQRFLEKIIQINFHIPKPDPTAVKAFIDATLNSTEEQPKEETSNRKIREATQQMKAKLKDGKLLDDAAIEIQTSRSDLSEEEFIEAKKEAFAESFDESNEVGKAAHDAIKYLEPNPRKIKRFINTFRLQALIANRRGLLEYDTIRLDLLAKWIVITMRWPQMIEIIESDRNSANYLDRDAFLEDLKEEKMPNEGDLIELIKTISPSDFRRLPEYSRLAEMTVNRSKV